MTIHPKVASTSLSGAIVVLLLFAASAFGLVVPAAAAVALSTVIGALVGYLVPSPSAPAENAVQDVVAP